jgi:hypothetical protein
VNNFFADSTCKLFEMALTFVGSASTVIFAAEFSNISIISLNRRLLIFGNQISNDKKGNVVAGINIQYK